MANLKISQLTPGNPAQSGDVIPIERSDVNFSITAGSIAALASIPWSSLANPTGNLSLSMGTDTTTFNQTSNTPWLWANTTTATGSTTNASPLLELAANYYTGSASAQDLWTLGSALAAGTNGASTLTIAHSGSTGNAAVLIPSASVLQIGSDTGISRASAGKIYVGNGTAGDFSGSLRLKSLDIETAGVSLGTFSIDAATGNVQLSQGLEVNGALTTTSSFGALGLASLGSGVTIATAAPAAGAVQVRPASGNPGYIGWVENQVAARGSLGFAAGSSTLIYQASNNTLAGTTIFGISSAGHLQSLSSDVQGSVSSAPTGIVATNVVVAAGAATATFTVSSTEGFTVGDTVTLSASGWTSGSGLASTTATVASVTSTTVLVLTYVSGGPWVAGTYTAQTGTLAQTGGTSVSVKYAVAYTSTPTVVVTPTSNAGAFYISASSTTGFTITYATSGTQTFNYIVMGNPS